MKYMPSKSKATKGHKGGAEPSTSRVKAANQKMNSLIPTRR